MHASRLVALGAKEANGVGLMMAKLKKGRRRVDVQHLSKYVRVLSVESVVVAGDNARRLSLRSRSSPSTMSSSTISPPSVGGVRTRSAAQRERSRLDYDADNNVRGDEMLPTDVDLSLDAGLAADKVTSDPIRTNDDEDAWFSLLSSGDPCAGYGDIDTLFEQGGRAW